MSTLFHLSENLRKLHSSTLDDDNLRKEIELYLATSLAYLVDIKPTASDVHAAWSEVNMTVRKFCNDLNEIYVFDTARVEALTRTIYTTRWVVAFDPLRNSHIVADALKNIIDNDDDLYGITLNEGLLSNYFSNVGSVLQHEENTIKMETVGVGDNE